MAIQDQELITLRQRTLQFLVHSFLYYKLGEPIISDAFFDQLTEELRNLRAKHPDAELPHMTLIEPVLGAEASAFQIKTYPPGIISAAFKLLYALEGSEENVPFDEFTARRGYQTLHQADNNP